jgi:hypothetical protein
MKNANGKEFLDFIVFAAEMAAVLMGLILAANKLL